MGFMDQTHLPFYQSLTSKHSTVNLDSIKVFNEQFYREFVHGKSQQSILSTLVNLAPKDRDQFAKTFEAFMADKPMLLVDRQALNEQYLSFLINDFNSLVSYSFVAVLFILYVFYKRIELVIVAAIPIALTGFITAGLMGLLQVPFNIFSSIVCTLVFGHGIDFSIFMTSALQKEYSYGKNEMPIYRTSIILAVLTTILAIGALIFAQHPALRSISSIALIGVSVAVLVTFVLYPILYKFLFSTELKRIVADYPRAIAPSHFLVRILCPCQHFRIGFYPKHHPYPPDLQNTQAIVLCQAAVCLHAIGALFETPSPETSLPCRELS